MRKEKKPSHTRKGAKNRLFDSMGQASAALGIDLTILKRAKELGCPAFRAGGRVNESELLKWTKENADALNFGKKKTITDLKGEQDLRRLIRENDLAEKILVKRSDVIASINAYASKIKALRYQLLENQYPTLVAGKDVPTCRILGKELCDKLDELDAEFAKLWNF